MDMKSQLQMQAIYSAKARGSAKPAPPREPSVALEDMDRSALLSLLGGMGVKFDRRWGVDRLRAAARGER